MYGKSKQDIGFDPSKTISKGKNAHDTYVSVENNTFWSLRSLCSGVKYHRRPNFMEHFRLLLQRPHFQALECRRENSPCDKLLAEAVAVWKCIFLFLIKTLRIVGEAQMQHVYAGSKSFLRHHYQPTKVMPEKHTLRAKALKTWAGLANLPFEELTSLMH